MITWKFLQVAYLVSVEALRFRIRTDHGQKSFRRSVFGTPAYLAPEVLRKEVGAEKRISGYIRSILYELVHVDLISLVTFSNVQHLTTSTKLQCFCDVFDFFWELLKSSR